MNVALQDRKVTASGLTMRARLLPLLVAFAVLWCGTGGSALACSVQGSETVLVAVDALDQLTPASPEDNERRSSPSGQAVAHHHHCCTATSAAEAPFESSLSLKEPPIAPASSPTLTSFAQAPPVQPPSA